MKQRIAKPGNKTKMVVGALFLTTLMAVNLQVGMNDGSTTNINLLGVEASIFAPAAVASISHCGRCDFESFGGVFNEEGENIGFCNLNQQYVYIGCGGNDGTTCEDMYQWNCMW